jgi:Uma2 family endonuclease
LRRFYCERKKCLGAPNGIAEMLSKSRFKKDLTVKFDLYQENGVEEYWIVNPTEESVLIYVIVNGIYSGS